MQSRFLLGVFCLCPVLAFAQEGGMRLDESYVIGTLEDKAPPIELGEIETARQKSPDAALGLALGSTALSVVLGAELIGIGQNVRSSSLGREKLGFALQGSGIGMVFLGLSLLPSTGHVYAGDWRRAALGIGLRTGASLLSGGFFAAGLAREKDDLLDAAFFGAAGVFGTAVLVEALFDLADSEKAVRRANQKNRP